MAFFRQEKADKLSEWLGIPVTEDQVTQYGTALALDIHIYVQYSIQHSTVQYSPSTSICTVQYSTVQYSTV